MDGSSSQYCIASLPDTSARLPAETNVETPSPRRAAESSTAMPRAPDWLKSPNRPGGGSDGASDAFRRTCGSLLTTPNELGPTTRMPPARASRTSLSCRARPWSPVSAKPLLTTTSPRTPAAAQSRTTSSTDSAGTATTARSTGPGASVTRRTLWTPCTTKASAGSAPLFTACTWPV